MDNKIVFLIRNVGEDCFGGGEIYQLKLAKKLKEAGFVPVILTNSRELLKEAKKNAFKTMKPPYNKNQNWSGWRNILLPIYFCYIMRLRRWYKGVFKRIKPATVNIQSRDDYLAATTIARKYGVNVLWTDHADFKNWILWNANVKYKNLIGKMIIKLSDKTKKVIFVSNNLLKETAKMVYPKIISNSIIIENGVEDELNNYYKVKEKENSLVFLGRVVEEKGINELIEAFKIVIKKYPNIELNIYGDGHLSQYKKQCQDCNKIFFYKKTDNPLEKLAENEIFVLPSYYEGLSLSLLEAAMMKKKIIATNVGGNSEIVINNITGLLVPPKNINKLSETITWILENKSESKKMAINARKRYEDNYDFDVIFEEKMLPLYNNDREEKL